MTIIAIAAVALLLIRWLAELLLSERNRRYVLAHAQSVPEPFREFIDPTTYARSVDYTLAKGRFQQFDDTLDFLLLSAVLLSGVLPAAFRAWTGAFGSSVCGAAGYLFAVGLALALPKLPADWYAQFRLEARFGFNTTTARTWWLDRLKGLLLALVLGYPLLVLVLRLVTWAGDFWWLWAWGCVLAFELLMVVLAPVFLMPLFNKFTPLPDGPLRERLLALANETGFRTRAIQIMDGSKRSRHSNAFFTGFGRFRKIVLFDTLLAQLAENELAAVLAHEIGHYKKRHIPKMLVWSAASLLVAFYALSVLARQEWFYRGFGFEPGHIAPAMLLFALLSGAVTFWFTPLANLVSRRFEYEADRYAAAVMREAAPLVGALRKLNEKNLSNLTPHPLYSGFYYSHPTLMERERALRQAAGFVSLTPSDKV